jgi:hypothetical protein
MPITCWKYLQSTGELVFDGKVVCTGYSGFGAAKNDPRAEQIRNNGPIPRGRYLMSERFDSDEHGPICFRLTPASGTETFGRSSFMIHGDSVRKPGAASHGCVVVNRTARLLIDKSKVRELDVI